MVGWLGLGMEGHLAQGGQPARPNLLVILCDDLGWGDLASYGHPHLRTPHLDRLAREGWRLTSAYSAAPVCSPSRVGLLTGRHPGRAGVHDWIPPAQEGEVRPDGRHLVEMRREELTVAQVVRLAGYATAMSGKWHCNARFNEAAQAQPGEVGFDHWFATQNNAAPSHANPVNFVRNGEPVGRLEGYSCRLVAGEAIGWLEGQRRRRPEQPFFLYVAFHEPHEPVASPPDLVEGYRDVAQTEEEAQYFANVENMDRAVGDLLGALDRLGVARNTLVVFTSDNGPETLGRYRGSERSYGRPGPWRGMKLWTTEAGCRVPGILRWPERLPAGQVREEPVSSLDLLPTFAALAGGTVPGDRKLDGTDLGPWLAGGELRREQPLFWIYFNAINEQRVSMREGPWKVMARLDGGGLPKWAKIHLGNVGRVRGARLTDFSLYDLAVDPGETEDRAGDMPDQLAEMRARLEGLYRDVVGSMQVWRVADP